MWHTLTPSSRNPAEFADEALELAQHTLRTLIYTAGGLCLLQKVKGKKPDEDTETDEFPPIPMRVQPFIGIL